MACCIVFNMYSLSSLTKILLRNILSYLDCLSPLTHFVLEVKSTLLCHLHINSCGAMAPRG